mgnify:CR=1 FL=1
MNNALCITDPGVGFYTQWIILSLMGLSTWLVLQTGRVSLGQQSYFGIGAYAAAVVTVMFNGSLMTALLVAWLIGIFFSAIISRLLQKLSGLQFALATLAIAELVRLGLSSWTWRTKHAKGYEVGPDGVHGLERHGRFHRDRPRVAGARSACPRPRHLVVAGHTHHGMSTAAGVSGNRKRRVSPWRITRKRSGGSPRAVSAAARSRGG